MKPWVSPFSMARPTRVMGRMPTSARLPDFRTSASVIPALPQWRVDIKGIGRDAVAHAARIVIQQIGGDDFEIVVGRVGETAFSVTVAERPDAGYIGAQLIVYSDVTALVVLDAGPFQAQVIGIGPPADRQQQMGAVDLWCPFGAVHAGHDAVSVLANVDAFRIQPYLNAFVFHNVLEWPPRHLHPRDGSAAAPFR